MTYIFHFLGNDLYNVPSLSCTSIHLTICLISLYLHIHRVQEKVSQIFYYIFYKTWMILMKFGNWNLE